MPKKAAEVFGFLLLTLSLIVLGFFSTQSDFKSIFVGYGTGFLGYLLINFNHNYSGLNKLIISLIISAITIPYIPNLSDDIYRFIWDGYSIISGINPYSFLPIEMVGKYDGLTPQLFDQLNSQEYYSVYPTISQVLFSIVTIISDDLWTQAITLKLIYFILHSLGAIYALKLFRLKRWNPSLLLLYFANPLVIIEGIGNLHAEINMVSTLFISLYFWHKKSDWLSALWFSFSIFIKLIPIIFLGYLVFRIRNRRYFQYLVKIGVVSIFLVAPMLYGIIQGGFLHSIDLYFRKFEFNASIYYILRWIGIQISGYNLIKYLGPLLLIIFAFLNLKNLHRNRNYDSFSTFIDASIFFLTSYLFLSTTIHPWYLIGLIGLSVFQPKPYILSWSFLITLSYINYNHGVYFENLWVVSLEYFLLLLVIILEKTKLLSLKGIDSP